VTPEGDPVVFATATYTHAAWDEIRRIVGKAEDFDLDDQSEPTTGGSVQFSWFETRTSAAPPAEPLDRRILATLTLTPAILKVEATSRRRRRACHRRLESLLGDRISLAGMDTKSVEEMLLEPSRGPEPEPIILPPEAIAELEDRMIRRWLDESIPALGGLTPRQAAETPEGRERLLALFEYIARDQQRREMPPGVFSPDYRKAKKLLGLG
jgi:hypothetical protein